MATGRPSSYSKEILEKAEEYLACYKELDEVVPTIEGLALHIGINRDTLYDWYGQENKQEFSDIVNRVRLIKSKLMQNGALAKKFDGRISALLLGHEGYREKQEIIQNMKHTITDDDKEKIDNILDD
jgi:hypothetical protein